MIFNNRWESLRTGQEQGSVKKNPGRLATMLCLTANKRGVVWAIISCVTCPIN